MKSYKYIIFITLFIVIYLFSSVAFAYKVEKIKLQHFQVPVDLNCNLLNKQLFCNITIKNINLTFPNVYLTIDLVKEGKTGYIYPSQYSDDNIFFEKNIELDLLPNEVKTIFFNYNLSNEFSKGKYRIDVYLHGHYISLSGIPFIFYNPKSYEFYLDNSGDFPYIKINRECTNIEGIIGPIGGLLNKSKAKLTICLDSKINGTAKVKIYIAEWNDIAFKPIIKQEFSVKVGKGLNKISKVIDISKLKPDAYSLRIEIYYDNKLNSLYRLRFIVPGPTAKIRGIYSNYPFLSKENKYYILVGPSPDHYTYPPIKNVTVMVKIDKYIEKIKFDEIKYPNFYKITIVPNVNSIKKNYKVCAFLYKGKELLDELCKDYNFSNIRINKLNVKILRNGSYITIKLVSFGIVQNKSFTVVLLKDDKVLKSFAFVGEGKIKLNETGNYTLNVIIDNKIYSYKIEIKQKTETKIKVVKSKSKYNIHLMTVIILIIITMGLIIMRRRREYFLLVLFPLFLFNVYGLNITIKPTVLCSPKGDISIFVQNIAYPVNLAILNKNYTCITDCTINLTLSSNPGSYLLKIYVYNGTNLTKTYSFNITFLYPYNFSLYTQKVYQGASGAILLKKNCLYVPNATFNISLGNYLVRTDCKYPGDPEWQDIGNACSFEVNVPTGTYDVYVKYNISNKTFVQKVGRITVESTPSGFTTQSCSHGWGTEGIVNPSIKISGEYTLEGNTYVIAKNSSIIFSGFGTYLYICSNGVERYKRPVVGAWIYKNNNFLDYIENTPEKIPYDYFTFKDELKEKGYIKKYVTGSEDKISYVFNTPGKYTFYLAELKSFCDSPLRYICPYNATLCKIGHMSEDERWVGFVEIGKYNVLVPDPKITGKVNNVTIYPENPIEYVLSGNIKNSGIGKINITIRLFYPNGIKEFYYILDENEETTLIIPINVTVCLHKDCDIPYEIWYDDAYGFNTYQPTLFARGKISIRWNSLNINVLKTTIEDQKETKVKIEVSNLGPLTAKEIKIQKIDYNPNCLEIKNNNEVLNLNKNQIGYLIFDLKIKNYNCKAKDYWINLSIYGWNTYYYDFTLKIPVSIIILPKNNSIIQELTIFKIIDNNANECYISFNNKSLSRICNKSFVYDNYCNKQGSCSTILKSFNQNFTFINYYVFYIPYYTSGNLVVIISPTNIFLSKDSQKTINIYIRNLNSKSIICQEKINSNLVYVTDIRINAKPLLSNRFSIAGKSSVQLSYTIMGRKIGIDNLVIKYYCNNGDSISVKIPVLVVGSEKVISNNKLSINKISANEITIFDLIIDILKKIINAKG